MPDRSDRHPVLYWNAFRTKMRFALGNIQRVVQGEPPLERVPGT